jgi:hypothetical protein
MRMLGLIKLSEFQVASSGALITPAIVNGIDPGAVSSVIERTLPARSAPTSRQA